MTNQMNVKEAEQRAQSRLVAQELKIMEAEEQARQEQERQDELARRTRDSNIEHQIVGALSNLKPLYEQRDAAYNDLVDALQRFMDAEKQIGPVLNREKNKIPGRGGMYPQAWDSKFAQLRLRAGIPAGNKFSGPPLAQTVALGLCRNIIGPGWVGNVSFPIK